MKICYVDESGHCGNSYDNEQPVEVLCGVVTDMAKLFKTQRQHSDIVEYLKSRNINLNEFKAKNIHRGRQEWVNVTPEVRDAVFDFLLDWSRKRVCRFIICPIDTNKFFIKKKDNCVIATKLYYPWETGALNIVLALQREYKNTKNNKGKTFIIFDEQDKHDGRFLNLFEQDLEFTDIFTCNSGKKCDESRLNQIIDVPHFSKSHLCRLIQLADIAAYIVNRYLLINEYSFKELYSGEKEKIRKWYFEISANLIDHTSIDPPGNDILCKFYREIRPPNWSARKMRALSK